MQKIQIFLSFINILIFFLRIMIEIMGNCLPWLNTKAKRRKVSILMVGLDNAGKTTAVKGVQRKPLEDVAPTIGFSSVDVKTGLFDVILIDLGGGHKIRDIWKNYFAEVHAVIFMVDSSDVARMDECKETFEKLLNNPLIQRKPVLLLANKQDKEDALEEYEICERLNVQDVVNENKCLCKVLTCSVITKTSGKKGINVNLKSGFDWLLQVVNQQFDTINERVKLDVKKRDLIQEEERKLRNERVRKIREERAKQQEEEEEAKKFPQAPGTPNGESPSNPTSNTLLPGQVADSGKLSSLSVRSGLGDQLLDEDSENSPGLQHQDMTGSPGLQHRDAEDSCTESQQRSGSRMSEIVRDSPMPRTGAFGSTDLDTPRLVGANGAAETLQERSDAEQQNDTETSTPTVKEKASKKKRRRRKGNQVIPLSSDQLPLSSVILPPIQTTRDSDLSDKLGSSRLPPLRPNVDSQEEILM